MRIANQGQLSQSDNAVGMKPPASTSSSREASKLEKPMQKSFLTIAMAFLMFGAATTALACGPGTVALIKSVMAMEKPPLYRCGSEFNEMLARAHKKDWKGALAAYEAHLAGLGKWEAGSANASETLAYLRQMSEGR